MTPFARLERGPAGRYGETADVDRESFAADRLVGYGWATPFRSVDDEGLTKPTVPGEGRDERKRAAPDDEDGERAAEARRDRPADLAQERELCRRGAAVDDVEDDPCPSPKRCTCLPGGRMTITFRMTGPRTPPPSNQTGRVVVGTAGGYLVVKTVTLVHRHIPTALPTGS